MGAVPADHLTLGKRGEQLACDFLREVGCEILVRGYRFSRAEVDIVMRGPAGLHFVEVKTRRWPDERAAFEAVSRAKQRNVMAAAGRYCDDHDYAGDIQFDVVVVLIDPGDNVRITWRQDAFGFWN